MSEVYQLLVYPDNSKVSDKSCGMKLGTNWYVQYQNGL